jgi:CheY-like chemotaxis protein
MNLVLNARDAMPRGGQLTLTTATVEWLHTALDRPANIPPGQWVTLTVHDTGVGMDAETLSRIFEPFYTTKDIGKGTGLGLATVYGIVQQSGGHIGVTSRPGAGTVFIVAFPPAAEAIPVTVSAVPTAAVNHGSETILLLEDNEIVRETAAEILTAHGYTILVAQSVEEALRLTMDHAAPIHLLLTDVIMPDMSGPAAAAQLAAIRPTMKILYMSGYPADEMVRHGLEEGRVHFLAKPFSVATLTHQVRQAIDSP